MRSDTKRKFDWSGRMEQLEDRLAMSADPLGGFLGGAIEQHAFVDDMPSIEQQIESTPDFWIETRDQNALDDPFHQIEAALAEAHAQTGLNNVRADYGFTGIGQTVAVIDSGIAYDHLALGGGFGSNYRVVGGWDFTGENDANPYDDGPSGAHGTHVAGIIGGDAGSDIGVAPGVDLVALRVFDDSGAGYFSWVENALDWIHANRNSFENPITAVNLSLGVSGWNSETIPNWANLEDEFAQLEADGIFIAVSAGNSFTSYNTTGLSYPAASSYVVPVMATDDSGQLSYFSQRSSRAIAAPGRWITSTVPDYAGNNNGIADDYATMSGTSMAAPYVAGSSVLIREAMEFAGYTNITQDMIYDQMMATADTVFDSATNQSYRRLNLEAAIDALMPADDYGSTLASAYSLGTVSDSMALSGAITTLGDVDYFAFTAANTGTVTFAATNTTNDLTPSWVLSGTQSLGGLSVPGDTVTIDVVAGQDYTVGFSTGNGLGYYDFDITAEASFTFTDWGAVSFTELQGISAANDTWYRVEAASNGYLTVEGLFDGTGGQISLELYDTNLTLVDTGNAVAGQSRVDAYAAAGEEFFVRVLGSNTDVDFRLTNLVSLNGTTVNVAGTTGDDAFAFAAGNTHQVSVNGVAYGFDSIAITHVNFNGGAGYDSITMTGTAGDETATLRVGDATLAGVGFSANALTVEDVIVYGGQGNDKVSLYDSAGDDTFWAWSDKAELKGAGFQIATFGFAETTANMTAGYDRAVFYDTAGNEEYLARPELAQMTGDGFTNIGIGFDKTEAYATSGYDKAVFYDSAGNDVYRSWQDKALMYGAGYFNYVNSFDETWAYASTGFDRADMFDTPDDDVYLAWSTHAVMQGSGFYNYARGFDHTNAYATGGYDQAVFYDSAGDDVFVGRYSEAQISGIGYTNYARSFDKVQAYATSGYDKAVFYDSAGNDVYRSWQDKALMYGAGYFNYVNSFDETWAYASTGFDRADMFDTPDDDVYLAWSTHAVMQGSGFYNYARGFDHTNAYATGGYDQAVFYDSAGDDVFVGRPTEAQISGTGYTNYARSFDKVQAYASSGNDKAYLFDSLGNDLYRAWSNRALMTGGGYFNYAMGFDLSVGYASSGADHADLYDSVADDRLSVRNWGAEMQTDMALTRAEGFDSMTASSVNGGQDVSDVDAVDYVFNEVGQWL